MPSPGEALQKFSAVIVTGGSSGIGKSFIELCGNLNPDLAFCNLSRRSPEIISKNRELKLCHVACDLSHADAVGRVAPELDRWLVREAPSGRILLINNSGFGSVGAFPDPNGEHQLGMIDVNVRAVVQLTALLLPLLKARGGAILTVASVVAFQPTPWMATYGATKAFVLHWSLALNEELRGTGVRALVVCPGPTSTNFGRRAGLKPGAVSNAFSQSAEEVVRQSLRALAAGRSQVVTGWTNRVAVFVSSILPKPVAARLAARVLERYRRSAAT